MTGNVLEVRSDRLVGVVFVRLRKKLVEQR